MAKNKISPTRSFEGWAFSGWFKGNWRTIKEGLKVGLPLIVSMQLLDPIWAEFIATILGKFVLDSGEFFFKRISL